MKNKDQIHNDIRDNFFERTMVDISDGSVMDLYTLATSEALEETYKEIDNNRTPHIFTKLSGQDLDDTGLMVNCTREPGESDQSYKYRLMNWTLSNEAGNKTSIDDNLLNLKYASSAQFIPFTEGVGTASIYIIPTRYEDEIIEKAIEEVEARALEKISQTSFITYIVPTPRMVDVVAYVNIDGIDKNRFHDSLHSQLKEGINEVAPEDYLDIGKIQKTILANEGIHYFNILEIYIDGKIQGTRKVYQSIETKFLLGDLKLVSN